MGQDKILVLDSEAVAAKRVKKSGIINIGRKKINIDKYKKKLI